MKKRYKDLKMIQTHLEKNNYIEKKLKTKADFYRPVRAAAGWTVDQNDRIQVFSIF